MLRMFFTFVNSLTTLDNLAGVKYVSQGPIIPNETLGTIASYRTSSHESLTKLSLPRDEHPIFSAKLKLTRVVLWICPEKEKRGRGGLVSYPFQEFNKGETSGSEIMRRSKRRVKEKENN